MSAPEVFRCIPLGCRLTRSACAARSTTARGPGKAGVPSIAATACRDCELGAAHRRGETPTAWADGTPLELSVVASASSGPPAPPPKRKLPVYQPRRSALFGLPASATATRTSTATAPAAGERQEGERMPSGPKPQPITWNGRTQSASAWAAELGISAGTIRSRHAAGTPLDAAPHKGKPARAEPAPRSAPTAPAPSPRPGAHHDARAGRCSSRRSASPRAPGRPARGPRAHAGRRRCLLPGVTA